MSKLLLASRSPRRIELMNLITSDFTVIPSEFDESTVTATDPTELVHTLSYEKAAAVFSKNKGFTVIGCDTIVCLDGECFGIPNDFSHGYTMLKKLSGKIHTVITGVCIITKDTKVQFEVGTDVKFFDLSREEISAYLKTNEAYDKAGGYGIQSKGALFVEYIHGDFYNAVGLPVSRLKRQLENL